jgi:hypothetical protein
LVVSPRYDWVGGLSVYAYTIARCLAGQSAAYGDFAGTATKEAAQGLIVFIRTAMASIRHVMDANGDNVRRLTNFAAPNSTNWRRRYEGCFYLWQGRY